MSECTCNDCGECSRRGSLTFAEAMALDPSEVEYMHANGHSWHVVTDNTGMSLQHFRLSKFRRRARPKRSRAKEMTEAAYPNGCGADMEQYAYGIGLRDGIRAVCEWLRTPGAWIELHVAPKELKHLPVMTALAAAIEREFLEPRP